MTDAVKVPRELLERLLAAQFEGDEEVGTVVSEIVALLAGEPPVMEEPLVVAFLMKPSFSEPYVDLRRDSHCLGATEPLMTVAQHRRIMEAK